MPRSHHSRHTIEALESRIAPAVVYPTIAQAEQYDLAHPGAAHKVIGATNGTPILLTAGEVLTTGSGAETGAYLLFVQQGSCIVFTTDLNNNGVVDSNEITGIAAGNGLRLISFTDIHGDIVTDLNANNTLSDSKSNSGLSNSALGGDGRVLLNNSIDLIEFRTLTQADVSPGEDVSLRYSLTNYSLYGNIYAGKSFGSADGGLVIDTTNVGALFVAFHGQGEDYYISNKIHPVVGSIETGTAASGQFFGFGPSRGDTIHPSGLISTFTPPTGQNGGDITNVYALPSSTQFSIGQIQSGVGGAGARGGNISKVTLNANDTGYNIIAGNGGNGPVGGQGGSISNLSDLGSLVGQVEVHSGNGGIGATGAGGAGGTISLGTFNVRGGLDIQLGNGGNGFSTGGVGASLPSGTITTPTASVPPSATAVVSTTHATGLDGVIGTTIPVDFNGDGFGDVVYATTSPKQLVVLLSEVEGTQPGTNTPIVGYQQIFLPIPYGEVDAISVGDFMANGHMDIAVGSGTTTQSTGVVTYLSQFSATGSFTGFSAPRVSPLPYLYNSDPTSGQFFGAYRANAQVTGIVAGDFAGDQRTGLAIDAVYYVSGEVGGVLTGIPNHLVMFLKPDLQNGVPDGYFYPDFGQVASSSNVARPFTPFVDISAGSNTTKLYLEATALSTTATHDVVIASAPNGSGVTNGIRVIDNVNPNVIGPVVTLISTGSVDTNRTLNTTGQQDHQFLQKANAGRFAVLDYNNDGKADFAVLITSPTGYMVSMEGDGVGNGIITSGTGDNGGTSFGAGAPGGLQIGTTQVGIHAFRDPVTGNLTDVGVLDYDFHNPNGPIYGVVELKVIEFSTATNNNPGATRFGTVRSLIATAPDTTVAAFDVLTPVLATPNLTGFATAVPDTNPDHAGDQVIELTGTTPLAGTGSLLNIYSEILPGITIHAGDGGNGLVGAGGNGGNIGGTTLNVTHVKASTTVGTTTTTGKVTEVIGQLNIVLPPDQLYIGVADFIAGNGGNGFTTGGNGGGISGASVAYGVDVASGTVPTPGSPPLTQTNPVVNGSTLVNPVSLFAGNGGNGVSGAGGNGGSITRNSIDRGEFYQAGDGGTGAFGGNGGNVVGNGLAGFFDTFDLVTVIHAGNGANGVKGGGNGGSVLNFHPSFNLQYTNAIGGQYEIVAGNAGSAISGNGGNGGSIVNDSPLAGGNFMVGDVILEAGNGGDGLGGGAGGTVTNFQFQPTGQDIPSVLAILGGQGGHGISRAGGVGGGLSNINCASTGQPLSTNNFFETQGTNYTYDRVIAGDGGSSAGGAGGNGGSITNVTATSSFTYFAMVAGAGGDGLSSGGNGGSVVGTALQFGGTASSKALVIAGAGGDATAWLDDPVSKTPGQLDKIFGGRIGKGGDGGNISNFSQSGGLAVRMDLIAGNGGDTVNYGSNSDLKSFVGKGGSVMNVNVAATIGNFDKETPIKSYNDITHGETVTDFVHSVLLNETAAFESLQLVSIDDSVGSVGLVVGAAGRLRTNFLGYDSNNQPIYGSAAAPGGVNGSVLNVSSTGIADAIAGNVERIGAITSVKGIVLKGAGHIGVAKDVAAPYLNPDGTPSPSGPVVGGALGWGALLSETTPMGLINGVATPLTGPFIFTLA